MNKCIDCKSFTGAGDFDLCCMKQKRRLTYPNDIACEAYEKCDEDVRETSVSYGSWIFCPWCYTGINEIVTECPHCGRKIIIKEKDSE